jgi:hypothetical protein
MPVNDALKKRIGELDKWLKQNCPDCPTEQAHLTEGSREQAYWYYGYMVALRDVLTRLRRTSQRGAP